MYPIEPCIAEEQYEAGNVRAICTLSTKIHLNVSDLSFTLYSFTEDERVNKHDRVVKDLLALITEATKALAVFTER